MSEDEAIGECRAIIVNTSFIGQSCVESLGNEQSSADIVQACASDVQVLQAALNYAMCVSNHSPPRHVQA